MPGVYQITVWPWLMQAAAKPTHAAFPRLELPQRISEVAGRAQLHALEKCRASCRVAVAGQDQAACLEATAKGATPDRSQGVKGARYEGAQRTRKRPHQGLRGGPTDGKRGPTCDLKSGKLSQ